ncbi:hypothetical protein DRO69_10875 [Candidatus Bathyarchaeota archaeon]|nr:MAG: hypothetical protein DRO69_10875 [Candidatus Bathyarchaeota archaeon]
MLPVIIDDVKKIGWKWCVNDQLISPGPVFLLAAMLVADSGGTAEAALYNGHNTTGQVALVLRAPANNPAPITPIYPIYLDKGLYLDVGSNVRGVLVIFWQE